MRVLGSCEVVRQSGVKVARELGCPRDLLGTHTQYFREAFASEMPQQPSIWKPNLPYTEPELSVQENAAEPPSAL